MKKIRVAFIKEIVPIIVGILIALYINNWNEERKDKDYINRISTSINKELTETNNDIDEKLVKQRALIDSLIIYIKNDNVSIYTVTEKGGGIYIPIIRTNAWKAISNSKIELMDYDKISTFGDIEQGKELLEIKSNKLLDFLYANFEETGEDKKAFLKLSMEEIMRTEVDMQKDIQKIIEE